MTVHRRHFLAGLGGLIAFPARAATPASGRLTFAVFRGGERIGDHALTFARSGDEVAVSTKATMAFKIGPLRIDYAHEAQERWSGEVFESLTTRSSTNGKLERVIAGRDGEAVFIETAAGRRMAMADTAPLTHWNLAALRRPLFNPQTGRLLRVTVARDASALPGQPPTPGAAQRQAVRGQAEIDDWYDTAGVWCGLRGRLPDRSLMEYRRV